MKYSIICSSRTGNTAQLAEVIADALPREDCVYRGAPTEAALSAPLLFVGFWTDKGSCDEVSKDFLRLLRDKTVFLFGTAGFGGSTAYFETILHTVKENLDASNTVAGGFMCQGRMPASVLERYEKMRPDAAEPAHIDGMIGNFHKAETHPDQADFDALRLAVDQLRPLVTR